MPEISLQQSLISLTAAALVAVFAWRAGALAASGAWAAMLVGGLIFGLGGLPWAALLLIFFISSSLLSRLFAAQKAALTIEKFAKGSRRDWGQVLANGGIGAFVVLLHLLYPDQIWPWLVYAGSLATVNGDTWATELGVLSASPPRLITTGQSVERGTSGGVSLTGTAATLAGAGLLGLVAGAFQPQAGFWLVFGSVTVAGFLGAFFDSLLGATVQAIYYDPVRQKETERQIFDADGQVIAPLRGWAWMNNDMVNFLSAAVGALLAVGFGQLF